MVFIVYIITITFINERKSFTVRKQKSSLNYRFISHTKFSLHLHAHCELNSKWPFIINIFLKYVFPLILQNLHSTQIIEQQLHKDDISRPSPPAACTAKTVMHCLFVNFANNKKAFWMHKMILLWYGKGKQSTSKW